MSWRSDDTYYRLIRSDHPPGAGRVVRCEQRPDAHDVPIAARWDLRNHSPDGFNWGYAGSGPAQTALAILADFTRDDVLAQREYQQFKRTFIQHMPTEDDHQLAGKTIRLWLQGRGWRP